jgi:hypothetical protein
MMKAIVKRINRMTIEEFATQHDLILRVTEREAAYAAPGKWYCYFPEIEIKKGGVLESGSGDGDTINDAIFNYCEILSNKRVVYKAFTPSRAEFTMPELTPIYTLEEI